MTALDPNTKKQLIASIKRFFTEKLDDDIGDFKAELVLDFALRCLGPAIYNQALADAQAFLQVRLEDMESSLRRPELDYWQGPPGEPRPR